MNDESDNEVHILPVQRVSDADRAIAVDEISDAYAQGRIEKNEMNARLSAVYSAATSGELSRLVQDLPKPIPVESSDRRALHALSVVLCLAWLIVGSMFVLDVTDSDIAVIVNGLGSLIALSMAAGYWGRWENERKKIDQ